MKHIYRSEILNKDFDTKEDCAAAEKKFVEKERAEREAAKERVKKQEEAKKNIETLSKSVNEAYSHYLEKLHAYQKACDEYRLTYDGPYAPRFGLSALGCLIDELLN